MIAPRIANRGIGPVLLADDLNGIFWKYASACFGVIGFTRSGSPCWVVDVGSIGDAGVGSFAVREEYLFALDSKELARAILAEFGELEPLNDSFHEDDARARMAAELAAGCGLPYVVMFNHDLDFVIFVGDDP